LLGDDEVCQAGGMVADALKLRVREVITFEPL
jgi:hypothetical protein